MPNSNHILLKNVRVVRGRMVNAFQSPLLFPPLNCRSRETTVVNSDLQNIQMYYRSKPSLCFFSCLLPLLKAALAKLLLQPGCGAELLSKLTAMDTGKKLTWFIGSLNSETNPFQEGVTRHDALAHPEDAQPLPRLCLAHTATLPAALNVRCQNQLQDGLKSFFLSEIWA